MIVFDETKRSEQIVKRLVDYAKEKGIVFNEKIDGFSDSSPYCIMKGGSSLSYRKHTRNWPVKNSIVVFATDVDAENLNSKLGLKIYDNSKDKVRPNAVFIPRDMFDQALEVLGEYPENI